MAAVARSGYLYRNDASKDEGIRYYNSETIGAGNSRNIDELRNQGHCPDGRKRIREFLRFKTDGIGNGKIDAGS